MDLARKIGILDEQIQAANNGHPADFQKWRTATEASLRVVMGEESSTLRQFEGVRYTPRVDTKGTDRGASRTAGVQSAIAILQAAQTELRLRSELEVAIETDEPPEQKRLAAEHGRVFIVHGHDNAAKHELARALHKLTGTEPTILHEQPNGGRIVLEKLEHYAAASSFAVVLLTGDDFVRAKDAETDQARARQNVVFEAGYFAGRLGRGNVVLLHGAGVELPSDLAGVVYVSLDSAGAWKTRLAQELNTAGIKVEWAGLAGQ